MIKNKKNRENGREIKKEKKMENYLKNQSN